MVLLLIFYNLIITFKLHLEVGLKRILKAIFIRHLPCAFLAQFSFSGSYRFLTGLLP